jgi:hypothetical protein
VDVVLGTDLGDGTPDLLLPGDDRSLPVVFVEQGLYHRMRLDLVPIAHHTESRPLSSSNLASGNEGARPLLEPILGQERLELCLKLGAVDEYRVAVPLVERLVWVGEKELILTILDD